MRIETSMAHWTIKYVVLPAALGIGNFFLVSWLLERGVMCSYHRHRCGSYPAAEENIFEVLAFPTIHFESVFPTLIAAETFNAVLWALAAAAAAFFWTRWRG